MANTKRNGAKKEDLPKGISRLPSGSYRVQISRKGHKPIRKTFEFYGPDTKENQKATIEEAEAWAAQVRQALTQGTYTNIADGPISDLAVKQALKNYQSEVTSKKDPDLAKRDKNRIESMMEEPWAEKGLLDLNRSDVIAFIHDLEQRGLERNHRLKLQKLRTERSDLPDTELEHIKELSQRIKLLEEYKKLQDTYKAARSSDRCSDLETQIRDIEQAEDIKPAAPSTVKNKLTLLSRALKHATKTVNDYQSPVNSEDMPGNNPGRERRLEGDEEERLLKAAKESELPQLELLIQIAIHTALRLGRVLALKWSYIEEVKGGARKHTVIKIPKNIQHHNKKAGTVPVTREIQKFLNKINKAENDDRLFPVSGDQVEYHFRVAREKAGLKDFRFHDLRHEATSRLFERGLDAVQVMSITGHTTTHMLDRYTHYSAVKVLEALEKNEGVANDADVLKSDFAHAAQAAIDAGISMDELMQLLPNLGVGVQ